MIPVLPGSHATRMEDVDSTKVINHCFIAIFNAHIVVKLEYTLYTAVLRF